MELASSEDKHISLYPILAGDEAIVLFLINQDEAKAQESAVEIDIPFGLKVKEVYQVHQFKEEIKPYLYRELSEGNGISLEIKEFESVMIFLVSLDGFHGRR